VTLEVLPNRRTTTHAGETHPRPSFEQKIHALQRPHLGCQMQRCPTKLRKKRASRTRLSQNCKQTAESRRENPRRTTDLRGASAIGIGTAYRQCSLGSTCPTDMRDSKKKCYAVRDTAKGDFCHTIGVRTASIHEDFQHGVTAS